MVLESISAALIAFISLISAAFTKIMIMFMTVLMVFFFIPQSRAASMLGVAVVSSFLGGTIIHLITLQASLSLVTWVSFSFTLGLAVFPFLMIFSQFYNIMSQDRDLHQRLYNSFKSFFLSKVTTILVDKKDNV